LITEFKYLFTPIDVGPMRLRNRIVSTSHAPLFGKNHMYTEQDKQVYILAKDYMVGDAIDDYTRVLLYRRLLEKGVVLMPLTWIRAISDGAVITYNSFTYQENRIESVDTVVHATGSLANDDLYRLLKGQVKELHAVGDCVAPREVMHSIYEGSKVGREL